MGGNTNGRQREAIQMVGNGRQYKWEAMGGNTNVCSNSQPAIVAVKETASHRFHRSISASVSL